MIRKNSGFSKVYLGVMLALMYIPIALIIAYSFNKSRLSSVWTGFTFDWYRQLFRDGDILTALINTLILALGSGICAAVIGTLGAVGMRKAKLPAKKTVEYIATSPIITPEIILGMVDLAFFSLIGLKFGMLTLMIAHTSFCIPYVYMQVRSRLIGLDPSYVEAAMDLGASRRRAFMDITLPMIAPAIATGMLLSFAMSVDDVVISVFVTGVGINTLPLKIYTSLKVGVTPKINALCTLMFLATLVIVFLIQLSQKRGSGRTGKKRRGNEKDQGEI
ncbi:MAG: ABC transporter permease [Firmicutes bacterium]|nr:ABC transporter permease [Bacillota bacterium]